MAANQAFKIKKELSNAKKLTAQGYLAEAIVAYNNILRQQPHNSVAKRNLARLRKKLTVTSTSSGHQNHSQEQPSQQQMNALISLYSTGRMRDAENTAKKLLSIYPMTLPLHNIYGATLLEQGKSQESLKVFQKAFELEPDNALTHSNLGSVFQRLGQLENALKSYNRAIELKSDDPALYLTHGNLAAALGQCEEAMWSFEQALHLKPDYSEVYYSRGNVLSDQGQHEEALRSYERCIELDPNFIVAYVNKGNSLKQLGRLEDAITSFNKARQAKPELVGASVNLGNIFTSQGKFIEAVKVAQLPLNMGAQSREAMTCLIRALNHCLPEIETDSPYAQLQKILCQIVLADNNTSGISIEAIREQYQKCNAAIDSSKLYVDDFTETQVWRGKGYYQGCDRHFVMFNYFNAIPRHCFSCYKVYVEPRTVVELFKLLHVFDSIVLPGDNTRKCMIETRSKISGTYKGYIYCKNLDEGKQLLGRVRNVVTEQISKNVMVSLKRGCSEYALEHPQFIRMDAKNDPLMDYKDEWCEYENYTDENLIKHIYPPVLSSNNHTGLTLSDTLIMRNWLAYAAAIGDSSNSEITDLPVKRMKLKKNRSFPEGIV